MKKLGRPTHTPRDQHRAWLELVSPDGPFLALSVLLSTPGLSSGMPALDAERRTLLVEAKPAFEKAWDALDQEPDDRATQANFVEARDAWVDTVFRDLFAWDDAYVRGERAEVFSPDRENRVTNTGAYVYDGTTYALTLVIEPVDDLREVFDRSWSASAVDRLEMLLREAGVPLGVVTDGRWWGLVSAQQNTLPASGITDSQTWIDERAALDAFAELLSPDFVEGSGDAKQSLALMFRESVDATEEITEALGGQVRRAVELLVQAFSESSTRARLNNEPDPLPEDAEEIYSAAVTVMMRIVFLLFAEERGLLPDTALYRTAYALGDERAALDRRLLDEGDESGESLDGSFGVWHRLLATSQALFSGASFEDLRLPAYGGSLFDPRRHPMLTTQDARGALAVRVSDLVMQRVLDAVQVAQIKGERRPISFSAIDVEQIGYIYEGLLGYTCERATEPILGLQGKLGEEPEIPLSVLREWEGLSDSAVAAHILAWLKEHQPAATPVTKAKLVKALASGDQLDADRRLRAVSDPELREEVATWFGLLRDDLRGRPVVIEPGDLLVVESPSRRNAGAHYTPRKLAEEVVLHALEPLVYAPGPYQTPVRESWRLKSSSELLELKVADIACGSGAFLVAAARYLGGKLVEAYNHEGVRLSADDSEAQTQAIRLVVARCLYGADINPMAIEMCKLSLWLVSLDPRLPFSFVDDKVFVGNSLLGVTDIEQVRHLHIDPSRVNAAPLFETTSAGIGTRIDVDAALGTARSLRRDLASPVSDETPTRSGRAKERQLVRLRKMTAQLRDLADGVIAAGLAFGGRPGKKLDEAYENLRQAATDAYPATGEADRTWLDRIEQHGLTPTVETDYDRWKPLHWAIELPDVFERGGFDAIIGNPPFLGGKKISPAMGTNLREWFTYQLAGRAGNGDLVAYFFLRSFALLRSSGTLGLIATNTVAQGDTREVGLDHLVSEGFTITRAIQSRSWPAKSANLEYAAVWGTRAVVAPDVARVADDVEVRAISTLLEPQGRTVGRPTRLSENAGLAFQGCIVLGKGFILEPTEAEAWIAGDPRNAEVLFPYLNGEDLNSRPDASASRCVVDFNERSEEQSRDYSAPWAHLLLRVKPERLKYDADRYPRMVNEWWKFWNSRPKLRAEIADLDEVLAIALVSKTVMPLRVPTGQVFSHKLGVFATGSFADQAVLSSTPHQLWAVQRGSSLGTNSTNYSPSDVFLTFPRPVATSRLEAAGRVVDGERREIMLRRELGLTKLYNLVNDPALASASDLDVARLREIHVELDEAVMEAYGWGDVPLDHGFHTYRQMERWTVSPAARVEILDRLLEENHRRAALQAEAPEASDEEDEPGDD